MRFRKGILFSLLCSGLSVSCTNQNKELQERMIAKVDSICSVSYNMWLQEMDSICQFNKKINMQRWIDSILIQRSLEVDKLRKEL